MDSEDRRPDNSSGLDWRQHMTDGIFIQINDELGPPTTIDQEFSRYQIAREAADAFWDWIVAVRGEKPPDWRAQKERKLTEVYTRALHRARHG